MHVISDFTEVLPGLTAAQLGAVVILAGFGLAAFAIHVVAKVARERRK